MVFTCTKNCCDAHVLVVLKLLWFTCCTGSLWFEQAKLKKTCVSFQSMSWCYLWHNPSYWMWWYIWSWKTGWNRFSYYISTLVFKVFAYLAELIRTIWQNTEVWFSRIIYCLRILGILNLIFWKQTLITEVQYSTLKNMAEGTWMMPIIKLVALHS
jgi:hypothetical protein